MAIITLTELKDYLGVAGTDDDARLTIILDGIQSIAEGIIGHPIASELIAEWRDGGNEIIVPRKKATSIEGVYGCVESLLTWTGSGIKSYTVSETPSDRTMVTITADLGFAVTSNTIDKTATAATIKSTLEGDGATVTLGSSTFYAYNLMHQTSSGTFYGAVTPVDTVFDEQAQALTHRGGGYITNSMGYGGQVPLGYFKDGASNVLIAYRSGWLAADIPKDIEYAIYEACRLAYDDYNVDSALSSESLGTYSWSKGSQVQSYDYLRSRLTRYQGVVFG